MQDFFQSEIDNPKEKSKDQIRLKRTSLRFNQNSKIIEAQSIENPCIDEDRKYNISDKFPHLSQ